LMLPFCTCAEKMACGKWPFSTSWKETKKLTLLNAYDTLILLQGARQEHPKKCVCVQCEKCVLCVCMVCVCVQCAQCVRCVFVWCAQCVLCMCTVCVCERDRQQKRERARQRTNLTLCDTFQEVRRSTSLLHRRVVYVF
jgi:hypothetical protein